MAPPIMLMAAMGATAAGGILGAFGKLQEGQATQQMYQYKAAVAEQNRKYQLQAGDVAAQRKGMEERYKIGEATVAQGASGLDINRGSAPLVRQGMHDVAIQEQGLIRSEFARRAYGEEAEAKLDIAAGKQAKYAGGIGAVSSILGAASSVSDKWLAGKAAGIQIYG